MDNNFMAGFNKVAMRKEASPVAALKAGWAGVRKLGPKLMSMFKSTANVSKASVKKSPVVSGAKNFLKKRYSAASSRVSKAMKTPAKPGMLGGVGKALNVATEAVPSGAVRYGLRSAVSTGPRGIAFWGGVGGLGAAAAMRSKKKKVKDIRQDYGIS